MLHGTRRWLARGHASRPPARELVRDFQWRSLYDPEFGYFATRTVVGHTAEPVDFGRLRGQNDWFALLRRLYKVGEDSDSNHEAWFTPAELFRPHYSRALATMALKMLEHGEAQLRRTAAAVAAAQSLEAPKLQAQARRRQRPRRRVRQASTKEAPRPVFRLFELGAGNGTNACHMLDHVRDSAPDAYERCELWVVEVSASLSARQEEAVRAAGHGAKLRHIRKDATLLSPEDVPPAPGGSVDVVVATEVLDNLPHDKAVWHGAAAELQSAVEDLAAELQSSGSGGGPEVSGSAITRSAAVIAALEAPGLGDGARATLGRCTAGWQLVSVVEDPAAATSASAPRFREVSSPMFDASGLPLPEADSLAASCLLRWLIAPAVAEAMARRGGEVSGTFQPRGGAAATGSALVRTLLDSLEAVREAARGMLYDKSEAEAPDGPWMPRARGVPGADPLSACLRGEQGADAFGTSPPAAVAVPIATGDASRPLGEAGTVPALLMGGELLQAARGRPADAVAVMLPCLAERLIAALHAALPGHGLIAADFHGLPVQPGGPAAMDEPTNTAEWTRLKPGDALSEVRHDSRIIHPLTRHDVAAEEVAPAGGTINAAVVQSRDTAGAASDGNARQGSGPEGRDHPSYLTPSPRGRADIFFATDFVALAAAWMAEGAAGRLSSAVDVAWQPHLLDSAGVSDAGRTQSGFNPMLHDYANTSVLLGWPRT